MSFGRQQPTVGISVTAASKTVVIPVGGTHCRVSNTGTVAVFIAFGVTAVTAVVPTADSATGVNATCIPAGTAQIVDVPVGSNIIGAIGAAAGPSLVYFELGAER